MKVEN